MENAGKLAWIGPLIDILLSANAETVDYQLSQMFQTLGSRNQKKLLPDQSFPEKMLLPLWIM